jgi:hypothetical protein
MRNIQEIFQIRAQYQAKKSQDVWEVEPGSLYALGQSMDVTGTFIAMPEYQVTNVRQ